MRRERRGGERASARESRSLCSPDDPPQSASSSGAVGSSRKITGPSPPARENRRRNASQMDPEGFVSRSARTGASAATQATVSASPKGKSAGSRTVISWLSGTVMRVRWATIGGSSPMRGGSALLAPAVPLHAVRSYAERRSGRTRETRLLAPRAHPEARKNARGQLRRADLTRFGFGPACKPTERGRRAVVCGSGGNRRCLVQDCGRGSVAGGPPDPDRGWHLLKVVAVPAFPPTFGIRT